MELGDQVVVRILGADVGLGVTVFFVVSVGRVAPLDAGLVVIVAGLAAVDSVTLCPRPCYKTSNYFLSSRLALCVTSRFALAIRLKYSPRASKFSNLLENYITSLNLFFLFLFLGRVS